MVFGTSIIGRLLAVEGDQATFHIAYLFMVLVAWPEGPSCFSCMSHLSNDVEDFSVHVDMWLQQLHCCTEVFVHVTPRSAAFPCSFKTNRPLSRRVMCLAGFVSARCLEACHHDFLEVDSLVGKLVTQLDCDDNCLYPSVRCIKLLATQSIKQMLSCATVLQRSQLQPFL